MYTRRHRRINVIRDAPYDTANLTPRVQGNEREKTGRARQKWKDGEDSGADRTQYCNNFNYGDTTDCHRVDSTASSAPSPEPIALPPLLSPSPFHPFIYPRDTNVVVELAVGSERGGGAAFKQVLLNKPLTRETTLEIRPSASTPRRHPSFLSTSNATRRSRTVEGLLAFVTSLNSAKGDATSRGPRRKRNEALPTFLFRKFGLAPNLGCQGRRRRMV